ncbi:MAG: PIN domain-containing protein [Chloroflexota bacterium]|nr:PIN domain-containing protein [Chloroflexota bacterium]MYD73773.1 type II toxin-antitoxin system VapC family toxin [Chloroflexota bacterium]
MNPELPVFVDSVYLIASFDPLDQWNESAAEFADLYETRSLLTTDGIIGEFLAHCSRLSPVRRRSAAGIAQQLRSNDRIEVVELTSGLVENAIEAYGGEFRYSRLSLHDCISILVMRERRVSDALTADREFSLAGINVLMQAPTGGR